MNITKVGYNSRHPKNFCINRPNGLMEYAIIITRSKALFTIHGEDYEMLPGTFVFYDMGTPQFYRALEDFYADDYAHVELDGHDLEWIKLKGIPIDTPICLSDVSELSEIFHDMFQEICSLNPNKKEMLKLYFRLLIEKLSQRLSKSDLQAHRLHYNEIAQLRTNIYHYPEKDWSVGQMAKDLKFSESYFQHLYKQIFGVSVMNDVAQSRISMAKFLLAGTTESIALISERCGYKYDVYFTKQFKKLVGKTPTEYRKKFQEPANSKKQPSND